MNNSHSLMDIFNQKDLLIALKSCVLSIIMNYNKFISDKDLQHKLNVIYKYTYDPIDFNQIANYIIKILLESNNSNIIGELFADINIDIDELTKFSSSINDTDVIYYQYISLLDVIDEIIKNNSDKELEYPEKFLDNIMFTPLTNPVILPETLQIVNRDTIMQYIMTDGTNPFNRAELSEAILNEFNEKEENKEMLKQLMIEKKEWEANQHK